MVNDKVKLSKIESRSFIFSKDSKKLKIKVEIFNRLRIARSRIVKFSLVD